MSWYEKARPTPFDNTPIEGLLFLDGDLLARKFNSPWVKDQKYPIVEFPSGVKCDIWESGNPEVHGIIHIFGEMDLPLNQDRDSAYKEATNIAEQIGYGVKKIDDHTLELWGFDDDEHYRVIYDNGNQTMLDIQQVMSPPVEPAIHPAHILLPEDVAENLPELYTNEDKGLDAEAIVKYFHPLSNWTWYASEYDPQNKLFFGLVVGHDIELGYFSLDELQSIGKNGRTLPIERDLHYKPQTLKELLNYHRKHRNE